MSSITKLFVTLIAINMIALLTIGHNYFETSRELSFETQVPEPTNYQFDDPATAYYVLQQLDIQEPVDHGLPVEKYEKKYKKPFISWIPDNEYCDKHRAYFVNDPEEMFNQVNFITDFKVDSNFKERVIPSMGNDLMPELQHLRSAEVKNMFLYEMRSNAQVFFIYPETYNKRHIGKQFACLSQAFNHIPGHDSLYQKSAISQNLVKYGERYESQPQCFNFDDLFLKTYVLDQKSQCQNFFNIINSQDYQRLKEERKIVYMRKIGADVHRGQGVFPFNNEDEVAMRSLYNNGKLCGQVEKNYLMQNFIHNPLLIEGHKGDFRIFMVIASTNPFIVFYHHGFFRISLHDYDVESDEKGAYLTNLHLSEKFFQLAKENGTYNGMSEKELRDNAMWDYAKLHKYLYEKGITKDPQWVDNYLVPSFQKAMIHLVRASQSTFLQKSSLFEIYGLDFMLDSDLKLWFIEANSKPGLEGSCDEIRNLFSGLLRDSMEVVVGLLRSRMKRAINYVNGLTRNGEAWRDVDGSIVIDDLPTKIQEFEELTKNRFEPEFEPSPSNRLVKIIDETQTGVGRYAGLVQEECL